ncbi:MAG: DUF4384 domain-containing protein [Prosthecobacter sp.]
MSTSGPDEPRGMVTDYTKVGFGARDVSVHHDASTHHQVTHNQNITKNEVTHVHQAPSESGVWKSLPVIIVALALVTIVALSMLSRDSAPVIMTVPAAAPTVILQPVVQSMTAPESPPSEMSRPGLESLPPSPAPAPASTSALLRVITPKTRYAAGEVVELTLAASRDGFVRVLYRDAGGATTLILPNAAHDGHLRAGESFTWGHDNLRAAVPGNLSKERILRLRVSGPPFGQEEFVAVFSEQPFMDAAVVTAETAASTTGMVASRRTKQIELEIEEVVKHAPPKTATVEARWQIETVPAP